MFLGHERRLLAAVVLGGAVGAVLRALLGETVTLHPFPWATFVANVVASGLLGGATSRLAQHQHRHRLAFVGTGICGGLSTFSTVQVETVRMLQAGDVALALGYTVATLVVGYAVCHLTHGLGRRRWTA